MLFEDTKEKNPAGRIALNKLVSHMVCIVEWFNWNEKPVMCDCQPAKQNATVFVRCRPCFLGILAG